MTLTGSNKDIVIVGMKQVNGTGPFTQIPTSGGGSTIISSGKVQIISISFRMTVTTGDVVRMNFASDVDNALITPLNIASLINQPVSTMLFGDLD
jgi:hypothetical protein